MPTVLLPHLGLALAVSAVIIGLGMFRPTRVVAVGLSLILLLLLPVLIPYPWFRYLGLVLLPLLLLCLWFKASARATLMICGLPMLLVIGGVTRDRWDEVARIDRLRSRFPMESLTPRLAYEADHPQAVEAVSLTPDIVKHMVEFEQGVQYMRPRSREIRLKLLHDESYRDFIASSGFGFERTKPTTLRMLDLPDPEPVPMPASPSHEESYLADREREQRGGFPHATSASPESVTEGRNIHNSASELFLHVEQWGYVTDREHSVGFQAHHVSKMPWTRQLAKGQTRNWAISQLQLVSLLKHKLPRVYVSENLPDLNDLADVQTRELSSFERAALPPLERDQDLVIDDMPTRIQMLGALRASQSCLQCHQVPTGSLLGAFSYVLKRDR